MALEIVVEALLEVALEIWIVLTLIDAASDIIEMVLEPDEATPSEEALDCTVGLVVVLLVVG